MQRWHKLRKGRIVASCECVSVDAAEVLLSLTTRADDGKFVGDGLIVTDTEWREVRYRQALMRAGRRKPDAEQVTANMRRRAREMSNGL